MAANKDNAIYLETDEDITSAIDKLLHFDSDTVQVVAAGRSTLFQSVINQKLIKKAADDAGKKLVLVTNDKQASNLAGRVGIPVASKVGEEPRIPPSAAPVGPEEEVDAGEVGTPPPPPPPPVHSEPEPPAVHKTPLAEPAATPLAAAAKPAGAKKKRIPDFNQLQKRTLWIIAGVVALILLLAANYFLASAKVTLFAKAAQVNASFSFTADTNAQEPHYEDGIIPATALDVSKTLTAKGPATGKKDVGTKASGSVSIKNCEDSSSRSLPAGTVMTASGKNFTTDNAVTVPGGSFSGGGSVCNSSTVDVNVTAAQNGDDYNLGPRSYTSPALNSNFRISGTQMQGGTTKTIQVVTQSDIDKAKTAALEKDKPGSTKELVAKAKDKRVLNESIEQKVTAAVPTPGVDQEGAQVTINMEVAYTALAVDKNQFSELVKKQIQKQIGDQNEIYDDGTDTIKLTKKEGGKFDAAVEAYAGARIDRGSLAKEMKGKKYGEAVELAARQPGVERAEIKLSPVWATNMPPLVKRIKIEIKVAGLGENNQ
ncbi:MAG TPA: hypothetical protein VNA68_03165 [Candidatus Dormibacteraeota bacterium]|nr:hypothetical protein [Candidatus Dormibacteraeota bacterium]